jgi:VanZ family protein
MAVLSRFAPPLALMAVIFFLSAQPNLATDLGVWDTILRKIAHMVEYGLLWFLWWRALGYGSPLPAIAIAIGYAITDELHQSTVDGRHGTGWDVAIDAAGVGLAGLATMLWGGGRAAGSRDRHGRPGDSAPARPPARP